MRKLHNSITLLTFTVLLCDWAYGQSLRPDSHRAMESPIPWQLFNDPQGRLKFDVFGGITSAPGAVDATARYAVAPRKTGLLYAFTLGGHISPNIFGIIPDNCYTPGNPVNCATIHWARYPDYYQCNVRGVNMGIVPARTGDSFAVEWTDEHRMVLYRREASPQGQGTWTEVCSGVVSPEFTNSSIMYQLIAQFSPATYRQAAIKGSELFFTP